MADKFSLEEAYAAAPASKFSLQEAYGGSAPPPRMESPPGVQEAMTYARRGVANLLGLPGDIQRLRDTGVDWLMRKGAGLVTGKEMPSTLPLVQPDQLPGSQAVNRAAVAAGLPDQEAQSVPGKLAGAALEGAFTAPFSGPAMAYGALAGAAGEGSAMGAKAAGYGDTGQTVARIVGGIAAPGAVYAARQIATPAANRVASNALGDTSPSDLAKAQELMNSARAMGSPITLAEALGQVRGPNRMQDVQRVVEQSSKGGPVMRDFYRDRVANNQTAFDATANRIAPPPQAPTEIAPRVQEATGAAVTQARQRINAEARPFYDAAERADDALRASPDYKPFIPSPEAAAAIKEARSGIAGKSFSDLDLPNDSFRVLDAAKRAAEDAAGKAKMAGAHNEARLWTSAANEIRDRLTSQFPDYAQALKIGREGRGATLKPLEREATGQLAEAGTFAQQRAILFPRKPEDLAPQAVTRAVSEVVKRDPQAARDLVRQFLGNQFDEATRAQASVGGREFNAARFRGEVMGNRQQAANLQAAIEALPDGKVLWSGFKRLMDVFEAQGARLQPGSATEFNRQLSAELAGQKITTTPLSRAQQAIEQFRYGRSTKALAELLTHPEAADKLRNLSMLNPASDRAALVAGSLLTLPRPQPVD